MGRFPLYDCRTQAGSGGLNQALDLTDSFHAFRRFSMPSDLNVIHAAQLATIKDHGGPRRGTHQGDLNLIPDGAVAIRNGHITAVGSTRDVLHLAGDDVPTIDATGHCVLPGLVECHSHPMYGSFPDTVNPAWEGMYVAFKALHLINFAQRAEGFGLQYELQTNRVIKLCWITLRIFMNRSWLAVSRPWK